MTIKLKKSGRLRAEIKVEEEIVESKDIPLRSDYPLKDGEPVASVGVSIGYRKSRDYQSVHLDVHVEVPTPLGKERQGLEYVTEIADAFLESKEKEVDGYLRSLT